MHSVDLVTKGGNQIKKKSVKMAVGIGALASACAAVTLLSVGPAFGTTPPLAIVENLSTPDVLPVDMDVLQIGDGGVDKESVVELADTSDATYWSAKDEAGNICLILASEDGPSAAACTPPEYFAANGTYLVLSSTVDDFYFEAYLVPDAVDADTFDELTPLTENLLVPNSRGALDSKTPTIEGTTKSGSDFDLAVPVE